MAWRRAVGGVPVAVAAVAGAALGHFLAYLLAAPKPEARDVLLVATGHAYWPVLVLGAVLLGGFSAIVTVADHFVRGLRRAPRLAGEERPVPLAGRLAVLQTAIYVVQEAVERAATHLPVQQVVHDRLLWTGLVVQVVVAVLAAVVLVWFGRVAEAIGQALRRGAARPTVGRVVVRPLTACRLAWRPCGPVGSRAPPSNRLLELC